MSIMQSKTEYTAGKRALAGLLAFVMVLGVIIVPTATTVAIAAEEDGAPTFRLVAGDTGIENITVTLTIDNTTLDEPIAPEIPERIELTSDSNGIVTFGPDWKKLINYTYKYSIQNDAYLPVTGEISISEWNETKEITLHPVPTIRIDPADSPITYGSSFALSVDVADDSDVAWYKDGVLLEGETGTSLEFDFAERNDSGVYSCTIAGTTTKMIVVAVERAIPVIELSFDPKSGELYSPAGVKLTASVKHPTNNEAMAPTGTVTFHVDGYETTVVLNENGEAELNVAMNSNDHTIYAEYSGDENYNATSSDIIKDYKVAKIVPKKDTHYTSSEKDGWFKNGEYLKIAPKEGSPFDQIREITAKTAVDQLVFGEDTASNGKQITFVLVDSKTGEESSEVSVSYKKDSKLPELRGYKSDGKSEKIDSEIKYKYYFEITDEGSGVNEEGLYWKDNQGKTHKIGHESKGFYAWLSVEDLANMRSIVIKDNAGNINTTNIRNKLILVSFNKEAALTDSNYYHIDKENPLQITLTALNASAEALKDLAIKINDEDRAVVWGNGSAENQLQTKIELPEDGEYVLSIEEPAKSATQTADYTIITDDNKLLELPKEKYQSNTHIVDTIKPEITVTYDPANCAEDFSAYSEPRTATFAITETNFSKKGVLLSSFSATDIEGTPIDTNVMKALEALLETTLESGLWVNNNNTYTMDSKFTFDEEGIYAYKITCTDIGGNSSDYEDSFVVDQSAPEELHISYITNAIDVILDTISFGFYNPEVEVQLSANDKFSGVKQFNWEYTRQEGASDINVEKKSGQIDSTDSAHFSHSKESKATSYASFTLPASEVTNALQYRGSISFTATDNAGNKSKEHAGFGRVSYIDTDGNDSETDGNDYFVIDTTLPERTVTYPEPQLIRNSENEILTVENKTEWANKEDPEDAENTNSILHYTTPGTISVKLEIIEANFDANDSDLKVKVNDDDYSPNSEWKQDGDVWTNTIDLTEDGIYTITVSYTDHSGNVMEPYTSKQIVLDRSCPKVAKYQFDRQAVDGASDTEYFSQKLEYGFYFQEAFKVMVNCSDETSGLNHIEYRLVPHGGVYRLEKFGTVPIDQDGNATIEVLPGFKGQIFAIAVDNAGNKSEEVTSQAFVVDNVAPTIDIVTNGDTVYKDAAGNRLFTKSMSITVTVKDNVSGIKEIGYAQSAEKANYTRKTVQIANTGLRVGAKLSDGWVVDSMDHNLVTCVHKEFNYTEDDNNVILTVDATDRSANQAKGFQSEKFTLDKTPPVIRVDFGADDDSDIYYNANRVATVTVTERNLDPKNILADIKNTYGTTPAFSLTNVNATTHKATIVFGEGDYHFDISGSDLGGHTANVIFSGGNEQKFSVDLTKPVIVDNFSEFHNNLQNTFNKDKVANIRITEHNFSPELVNLQILRKEAGAEHSRSSFANVTAAFLAQSRWQSSGDVHEISFVFSDDAVYEISLSPKDLADNAGDSSRTGVFEIDQTAPTIAKRNGRSVSEDDTHFCDVYDYSRRKEPFPQITFNDIHIDHISYTLNVWIPDYSNPDAYPMMKPQRVYLPNDPSHSGVIMGDTIELSQFTQDGVYELHMVAEDVVGNQSAENVSTYARMVERDVLAYIENSSVQKKSGLYSFQSESGAPISMRSDQFKDLSVIAFAKAGSKVDVVLRDNNAVETPVGTVAKKDSIVYGIDKYAYIIPASTFKDLYPDDTDITMQLSVKNENSRIDLGRIHIDNIAPECSLPEKFASGHWYYGNEPRVILLSNISEELDENTCKVYDNGEMISFNYLEDENSLSFVLNKGWHNVGVILSDLAGNEYDIQEKTNIYVGYFWLYVIIGAVVLAGGLTSFALIRRKRKNAMIEV